eukprot:Nk52_evm8s1992 gene=Nk52_evmTU8s1992
MHDSADQSVPNAASRNVDSWENEENNTDGNVLVENSTPQDNQGMKLYYEKLLADKDERINYLEQELLKKSKMCDDLLETISSLRSRKESTMTKNEIVEDKVQEPGKASEPIGRKEVPVQSNKRETFKRGPKSESAINPPPLSSSKEVESKVSGNKNIEAVKSTHASSLPSSPTQARKKFTVKVDKCQVCTKTVYPMEKLVADGTVFHKVCLKCAECKKVLNLGNYAALEGMFYCKPHFKQLFMKKGNYDEGFGREQHKKKWETS